MLERNITASILDALRDTPVVLLNGARQTGKSTLVQWITQEKYPAQYLTLDDPGVYAAVRRDAVACLESLSGPVVIDEVQLAPELFRAIKFVVDRDRQPGQFLLTGSANVLMLPRLSDTLAGRMEILTLWPFSQGELKGGRESFVDALWASDISWKAAPQLLDRSALFDLLLSGGYPEAVSRSVTRRQAWFNSYISTMIHRDIREMSDIEGRSQLPRLLEMLALQAMSLLNMAELSRVTGITHMTLKRYVSLLEAAFLVQPLRPWSGNVRKRLIRTPKMMFNDTGLLAHLLGLDHERLLDKPLSFGPVLENFVGQELCKQITWSQTRPRLFYFRTAGGHEVDFVLEDRAGRIVGIEVKASSTVGQDDWSGLDELREITGKRFYRGVILYTGQEAISAGHDLQALPIQSLWKAD